MFHKNLRINKILWVLLIALLSAVLALNYAVGMDFHVPNAPQFLGIMAICFGISLGYRHTGRNDAMVLFGHTVNQFIVSAFILSVLEFTLMLMHFPMVDAAIIRTELALGIDWRALVAASTRSPAVALLLQLAYNWLVPMLMLAICVLFATRRVSHAQRLLIAYLVSGIACIVIAALLPTMGAYSYYHYDPFTSLYPDPVRTYLDEAAQIDALRSHRLREVSFPNIGLVFFPSFHAAGALLLIYAAWPVRGLKWAYLAACGVMFLSLPFAGGHYVTDIIAGLLIALAGIALAKRCVV